MSLASSSSSSGLSPEYSRQSPYHARSRHSPLSGTSGASLVGAADGSLGVVVVGGRVGGEVMVLGTFDVVVVVVVAVVVVVSSAHPHHRPGVRHVVLVVVGVVVVDVDVVVVDVVVVVVVDVVVVMSLQPNQPLKKVSATLTKCQ